MTRLRALLISTLLLVTGSPASAGQEAHPSAEEVKRRWLGRLEGCHFTATIRLRVQRSGDEEVRKILVWRDDNETKHERLMARFSFASARSVVVSLATPVDVAEIIEQAASARCAMTSIAPLSVSVAAVSFDGLPSPSRDSTTTLPDNS